MAHAISCKEVFDKVLISFFPTHNSLLILVYFCLEKWNSRLLLGSNILKHWRAQRMLWRKQRQRKTRNVCCNVIGKFYSFSKNNYIFSTFSVHLSAFSNGTKFWKTTVKFPRKRCLRKLKDSRANGNKRAQKWSKNVLLNMMDWRPNMATVEKMRAAIRRLVSWTCVLARSLSNIVQPSTGTIVSFESTNQLWCSQWCFFCSRPVQQNQKWWMWTQKRQG